MKKLAIVLLVLAGIAAGIIGLMQWGINSQVNRLLAEASRQAGAPVKAASFAVSLWRGAAELRGLSVANREGFGDSKLFTLAQGRVAVRYLPLFRKRVCFDDVTLRDAELTIVRAADGQVNVKRPGGNGGGRPEEAPGGEAPTNAPPSPPLEGGPAGKLPAVAVERLRGNLNVHFVDQAAAAAGNPAEILLQLTVGADNLATYGNAANEAAWGALTVDGSLQSGDKKAPIHLTGRIAPVLDPQAMTFTMNGTVEGLDPDMMKPLMGGKDIGVRGEAERVEIALVCNGGRFDEANSKLTVTLKNVKAGNRTVPSMKLDIPVHGKVDKPKLRMEQALIGAMNQLMAAPEEAPANADGTKKHHHKSGDMTDALTKGLNALLQGKP